jgi:hypothetical protein
MEAVETKEPVSETPQKEDPTTTTTTSFEQPASSAEESKKEETAPSKDEGEKVSFTIVFKKQTFNVEFGLDRTIGDLRQEVAK